MPPRDFWRLAHSVERLAQLKLDLHDALGRLLTQCYEMARSDDSTCSDYWNSEGRYWEQQYHEAIKMVDQMLTLAAMNKLPATHQINDQRTVVIGNINAGGDVIIATVQDATGVTVGKEIKPDANQ
jgi:hypothetical protein